MAEFHLKMIKIFFVVVIAMLVLSMTSGMNILRGKKLIDWKKIGMEVKFMQYKKDLAAQNPQNAPLLPAVSGDASSIPILLYHGVITDKDWEEDGTNTSLEIFKQQMFALKKAGYQTVTLADFYDYMKNGKTLPKKSIIITFDDGRKDSYYEGDPILKAVGFNAVMFLITGRSLGAQSAGDNFYLGKSELQDMIKEKRWEIQSHGDFDHNWQQVDQSGNQGHFMSNLLWLAPENRLETPDEAKKRIFEDLAGSKKKIENELDQKVVSFAYPFNDYGQESVNYPDLQPFLSSSIGKIYPLTFFQVEKNVSIDNYPDPNQIFIKRIDVDSSMSANQLLGILDRNQDKELPFADTFWNNQGWKSSWGETKVFGDMTLSETETGGGNLTLLLGTSLWKDYFFESRAQIVEGNSVSQIVRYTDDENYAECSFSRTGISILQKIDGKEYTLAEKVLDLNSILASETNISTRISGNEIACYLGGNAELGAQISPNIASGGIGFATWDDLPQNAVIRVEKVNVSAI
jgi:peptidoglycan/xylan/chitin deacetylase (PgdA/CDA1 family)